MVVAKTGAGTLDEAQLQEPIITDEVLADTPETQEPGVFPVPGVNDQEPLVSEATPEQIESLQEPVEQLEGQTQDNIETNALVDQGVLPEEQRETIPQVQPEPVKEEPVLAPKPTPTAEKVETAEDIKTKQLDIQQKEQDQVTKEQEKANNDFIAAFTSGNMEGAKQIAIDNPEMKSVFESSLRASFKNEDNLAFFTKYNGATNDKMKSAAESGDLVIGSTQYNSLPEAQRRRFEQFNKLNISKKTDFTADNENVISLQGFVDNLQGIFNFDLRKKMDEAKNAPEMTKIRGELEDKQNDISEIDAAIEALEDDIIATNPKLPRNAVLSLVARDSKNLIRQKNSLVNQYNAKLGTYKDMKSDLDMELKIATFEDAQQKQLYSTALTQYNQAVSDMREDEKLAFLEQNKRLATETQLANSKELAKFNASLRESGSAGGKYVDDGKGNLVYVKAGKKVNVLSGLGEPVGTADDENYSWSIKKNEDGSYSAFGLPKEGDNIFMKNFGADGEEAASWIQGTGTGSITSYGGEHDKFQGLDIDGNVGDPIASVAGGKVIDFEHHRGYGTTMVVKGEDGNTIRYSHMDKGFFRLGDKISKGAVIGTIGNSGNVLKLDGTRPTRAELKQGFGSHLDIVTIDENGRTRSAKETESYLNNLGISDRGTTESNDEIIATGIINGVGTLKDITPTDKKKILPIVNRMIKEQTTDDENRNVILKSSTATKDISDTALNKIADMETVKFQLNRLETTLNETNNGPILGVITGKNPYSTETQVAMAQLAGLTPKVARGIFGEVGVLTDNDIRNYQRALPNVTSTSEKNQLVLDFMRDLLTEGYKNAIVTQAKGGRNMSQFLPDYDIMTGTDRTAKYLEGTTITTSSGFQLSTGVTQTQNNFFNQ